MVFFFYELQVISVASKPHLGIPGITSLGSKLKLIGQNTELKPIGMKFTEIEA